jgi:murein DD-endopeptidase MepM/ murein hydrolase activator NlpD
MTLLSQRRCFGAVTLCLLVSGGGLLAVQDRDARLEVQPSVLALSPGGVVLLTVRSAEPLAAIEGEVLGQAIRFWPTEHSRAWSGLATAGLDAQPGTYELGVQARAPDGNLVRSQATVRVQARQFETRRLQVQSAFVDPPASEHERIGREAKLLAHALSDSRPGRVWRGPFVAPVSGQSTSSYGRLTILNGQPQGRHLGADFRAAVGVPVRAPNAGRVVLAADLYFTGNTIVVDHGDGLVSLFAHLSRIAVEAGALAARGDLLGEAGATGRVTGPHLHWAVRLENRSVDPEALLRALANIDEQVEIRSGG